MAQHYFNAQDASSPIRLPDLETFYLSKRDIEGDDPVRFGDWIPEIGWYWQACFPGCLPDGDPSGPFETEAEALADAREGMED